jgi:hypothetical protein
MTPTILKFLLGKSALKVSKNGSFGKKLDSLEFGERRLVYAVQLAIFELLLEVHHRVGAGSYRQLRHLQGVEAGQADGRERLGQLTEAVFGRLQDALVQVGVFAVALFETRRCKRLYLDGRATGSEGLTEFRGVDGRHQQEHTYGWFHDEWVAAWELFHDLYEAGGSSITSLVFRVFSLFHIQIWHFFGAIIASPSPWRSQFFSFGCHLQLFFQIPDT